MSRRVSLPTRAQGIKIAALERAVLTQGIKIPVLERVILNLGMKIAALERAILNLGIKIPALERAILTLGIKIPVLERAALILERIPVPVPTRTRITFPAALPPFLKTAPLTAALPLRLMMAAFPLTAVIPPLPTAPAPLTNPRTPRLTARLAF
jgi:hypothetical protein